MIVIDWDLIEKLAQELHDARHSQLRASSQYERASEKMEGVNGERTLLQVKVARLNLKLKEAQLQRICFSCLFPSKEIIKIKANAIKKISKILIYITGAINAPEITTKKNQNEMKK